MELVAAMMYYSINYHAVCTFFIFFFLHAHVRMDGSSNNFAGNLQGSPGQMDNSHLMFNMHSPMNASDQVLCRPVVYCIEL